VVRSIGQNRVRSQPVGGLYALPSSSAGEDCGYESGLSFGEFFNVREGGAECGGHTRWCSPGSRFHETLTSSGPEPEIVESFLCNIFNHRVTCLRRDVRNAKEAGNMSAFATRCRSSDHG